MAAMDFLSFGQRFFSKVERLSGKLELASSMLLEVMKEVESLMVSEKEAKLLSKHLPNMVKENEKGEWTLVKPDLLALQAKLQEICLWTQSSSDTVSFQSESEVHNAGNITVFHSQDASKPEDCAKPNPECDPAVDWIIFHGSATNETSINTLQAGQDDTSQNVASWTSRHGTATDQFGNVFYPGNGDDFGSVPENASKLQTNADGKSPDPAEDDGKPQTDADGENPESAKDRDSVAKVAGDASKPQTNADGENPDPAKDNGSIAKVAEDASKPQTDPDGESPDPAKDDGSLALRTLQMLLNLNDANVAASWSNWHGTSTDQAGQDEASWSNCHGTSTDQAGQDEASWSNCHGTSTDQAGQDEASWSNCHGTSTDQAGQDEASWSNCHGTSTDEAGQFEASWSNWHWTSTDQAGQDEASWNNWHWTSTN